MRRTGLYPGTFDPVTLGHIDIIKRAAKLVDRLYIGIAINRDKGPLFDLDERVTMIENACIPIAKEAGIEIIAHPFENLLIQCAREVEANVVIRGLRAVSDFEYEFQLASMNRHLAPEIETVFFTPDEQNSFISASLVREIARLGGDVSGFVAPNVNEALLEHFGHK